MSIGIMQSTAKEIQLGIGQWRKGLAVCFIVFLASLIVPPALWPHTAYAQEVTNVTSTTTDGFYSPGDDVYISVTFSERVIVKTRRGTPYLELETGRTDRHAVYISGSGSDTLTFRYTVQAGDRSSDLEYRRTNSLKLNGGAIENADDDDEDADLRLASPGQPGSLSYNKDLVIGTTTRVTNVTSNNSDRTYTTDEDIYIKVTFSQEVYMTGWFSRPYLELETGKTDRHAVYVSGSGTEVLTFSYLVQAGDTSSDLNYRATDSLKLNGGTIKDSAGNDATLLLAAPGEPGSLSYNKNLVIETTTPTVTSVTTVNMDGIYKKDQFIDIIVTLSQVVEVTGTPYLELETGRTDRHAIYISGSGSDTLIFNYTVQAGDTSSDLDYRATDSLKLNGGTIRDAAGNDAKLVLAAPGETGSLGYNKTLVIDAEPAVNYEIRFPGIDTGSIYLTTFSNQLPTHIDAIDMADTNVQFRYTGIVTGEVMIAKYKEAPPSPTVQFSALESEGGTDMEGIKFVDVYVGGFNEGTAFITIYYSGEEVSNFKEDSLSLFYWDGSAWQEVANISRYPDANIILGEVPVSALSGTPIGLGGDENQDQGLIHFVFFGMIGGVAILGILILSFKDYRKRNSAIL